MSIKHVINWAIKKYYKILISTEVIILVDYQLKGSLLFLNETKINFFILKYEYEYESYLKQPSTPSQCKIIVAYRTSNHRPAS